MNTKEELVKVIKESGVKRGAEVGVAAGAFSLMLCEAIPDLKLFCIDPWIGYDGNRRGGSDKRHSRNYQTTRERLSSYDATLMRMKSMQAVSVFADEALDFVFIDGNHDYAFVKEDIEEWSKKVKSGGIVACHDYYHFKNSGVVEAVDEYTNYHRIQVTVIGEMVKRLENKTAIVYWRKP